MRVWRGGKLWVAVFALVLAACAGRDPHPVAVVQPQDAQSDCAMIRAEIEANNVQAEKLAEENHAKIAQNVAAGVVGVVVWPVWFAMDAKGAAGTEMDALKARQEYLANLARQRCAQPAAPAPPLHLLARRRRRDTNVRRAAAFRIGRFFKRWA
jgi:hypothetical protein